ncbi:hypothetical protein [Neorhizobium huautlense]|uniref:hypothetical protein n=1 Tax=Neorhizobium huautlense TaxID=67774 RepID=UPI000CFA5C27|nr:hypothetical protein [Neorhizobium huautlense]
MPDEVCSRQSEALILLYAFGGKPALALADIADLLLTERDLCYAAFEAFQALIGEQTTAISNFQAAEQSPENSNRAR